MSLRAPILVIAAVLVSFALPVSPWLTPQVSAQTIAPDTVVVTSEQSSYGAVLATGDGRTLYDFTFDSAGRTGTPASSSCTGRCAGAWPPLLAPSAGGPLLALGGVQQRGLGTALRPDGTYQVTYFGHPLYGFSADKAPGQTNGENVAAFDGLWYLVSVTGQSNAGTATVMLEMTAEGNVLAVPTAFSTYRSLYDLTTDPPNVSTCFGGCARFWPPLLTTGQPVAAAGVNPAGLGTLRRPDGTLQVTYFGVPLYTFAFDLAAGAKSGLTNGENIVDGANKGIWYLMSPAGNSAPAQATVTSTSTAMGTVLSVDKNLLYTFSADSSAASACVGLCARIWTPLLTTGAPSAAPGSGVDPARLGTMRRPDGTIQVTYNGAPLYMFAEDFTGPDGQGLSVFGGTFRLMQTGGTVVQTIPTARSVVAVPQLTRSSSGTSAWFTVAFSSKNPGQSMVLFGSGPGCNGLIETATRDSGSGTTNHSVTVTGNDLPGSVGDNGIQPGATYSFEVVTLTSSGQELDNNGGKCYTVTIPAA